VADCRHGNDRPYEHFEDFEEDYRSSNDLLPTCYDAYAMALATSNAQNTSYENYSRLVGFKYLKYLLNLSVGLTNKTANQ